MLVVKAFLSGAMRFVSKHWKTLLFLVLLYIYSSLVYDFGFNSADKGWIDFHNRRVKELNDKIARLERESKAEAKTLKADAAAAQWSLEALAKEFPKMTAKDKDNRPLTCNGQTVTIYLGSDFSKAWNELNDKGAEK